MDDGWQPSQRNVVYDIPLFSPFPPYYDSTSSSTITVSHTIHSRPHMTIHRLPHNHLVHIGSWIALF